MILLALLQYCFYEEYLKKEIENLGFYETRTTNKEGGRLIGVVAEEWGEFYVRPCDGVVVLWEHRRVFSSHRAQANFNSIDTLTPSF